jgi:PhzF family phenazine biosynthesis protein
VSRIAHYPIWQVDAFSSEVFGGNPAAVVSIHGPWPADDVLQAIAAENNLSETAFVCLAEPPFALRWFTPVVEVPLCGHATLATVAVMHRALGVVGTGAAVQFATASGPLRVQVRDGSYVLDFPGRPCVATAVSVDRLADALGVRVREAWESVDRYVCVLDDEAQVRDLRPAMQRISALDLPGIVVTAPGNDCDFVSRYFAPAKGIPEDPVTGTSHCTLVPFWGQRLGKTSLRARQLSPRGGQLDCSIEGDRVHMSGACEIYLQGSITVPLG